MLSSGPMPPTKSRPFASWSYLACRDRDAAHDGTLTVNEDENARGLDADGRPNTRMVTSTYELQATPAMGFPGTAYLLVKVGHAGDLDTVAGRKAAARIGEVYETHLHADGRHRCTCTAGMTEFARPGTAPCLHVLAIREMEANMGDDLPTPRDHNEWERGPDRLAEDQQADVLGRKIVTELGGA